MTHTAAGRAALDRCAGSAAEFLAEHWGRRPLVRRAGSTDSGYGDLLDLGAVDRLVTSAGLRTPALRLVRDGKPVDPASYTATPRIGGVPMTGLADPGRVLAHIDAGATLVLQGLHRYWEPLRQLCRDLEAALSCSCQANAYITPPGARGLDVHSDPHDVFVLQSFGEKRWEVHGPDGVQDVLLRPGDSLYLPLGTPHAATAQDVLSGHVTVGLVPQTWREVLTDAVREALTDPGYDERLPAGWADDPQELGAELSARLADLRVRLDKVDPAALAAGGAERFWTSRPSALAGGLLDRVRLAALDEASVVRRRTGAVCRLHRDGDRLVALLGDRSLRMPAWVQPAVEHLVSGEPVTLADVALDAQSRSVLVRRLVREGLLEVCE